jgi:DNA polymerase iota
MLAKLVSGLHKPDDQTTMPPPEAVAFVAGLPARALPGGHMAAAVVVHRATEPAAHAHPDAPTLSHVPCLCSATGVGFKLDGQLAAQGIKSAADVRRLSRQQLVALLGERAGLMLYDMCRGRDSSAVRPAGPPKSITVEDSFKSCAGLAAARAVLQVRR